MPLDTLFAASAGLLHRDHRPEIMDQLGLDYLKHRSALTGLRRLNLASGVCKQLCKELIRFGHTLGVARLNVLDIASGGGDVPFGLWKLAQEGIGPPHLRARH